MDSSTGLAKLSEEVTYFQLDRLFAQMLPSGLADSWSTILDSRL